MTNAEREKLERKGQAKQLVIKMECDVHGQPVKDIE